jgi:signal peptidase I
VEGDQSDRERVRGDEFPDYRSTARDRATPSGSGASRPRAGGGRDGVTYSASAKVPDPSTRPGPYPPVSRPPVSYRPESGRPESGRPETGPPVDWPPRRPAADRRPTTPPRDPWRHGQPRDAWTEDPVPTERDRVARPPDAPRNGRSARNGASPTRTPPSNGRPGAWPARQGDPGTWPARRAEPDAWPPRNGEGTWPPPNEEVVAWPPPGDDPGGWSPPVIAPPDSVPPLKAPQRGTPQGRAPVRGGEAAGWAPPGGRGTDVRPDTARGVTPRGEMLRRGMAGGRDGDAPGTSTGSKGSRDSTGTDGTEEKTGRKGMPLWQELPLLLVVAFCLAVLIRTFLLQAFYIPSGSMEDTLLIGDRVVVNKVVYDVRDPRRGEVVVFKGPANWVPETPVDSQDSGFVANLGRTIGDLVGISTPGEKDFIKRVIGLPGDTVACCDDQGRVTVNGTALDEPYVIENSPLDTPPSAQECRSRKFGPVKVDEGQLFVMGDHRLVSQDSRCQGQVPIGNVIGRAFVIVWPNDRWDRLPVPSTFDNLAAGPPRPAHLSTSEAPGTVAVLLPLLLSGYISARNRHSIRGRRRRLAP